VSLQGALAGLLLGGPGHGYELAATLEAELGPTWSTRVSQVYLTLGRMARDGLLRSRRVPQATRPDRQLLTLTAAGRRLGEQWLWGPSGADEIVVRLMVGRLVIPDRYAELAQVIAQERTSEMHRLRSLRASVSADEGFGSEALEREIRRTEADLRWVTRIRDNAATTVARPSARRRRLTTANRSA
jgi:DNA-binding PadR family transcriptional regulator